LRRRQTPRRKTLKGNVRRAYAWRAVRFAERADVRTIMDAPIDRLPPVGVGLSALSEPADGLDRMQWLLDHGVESVQIPLAPSFGLAPGSLMGARLQRLRELASGFRQPVLHAPYQSVSDVTFISPTAGIVEASLAEVEKSAAIAGRAGIGCVIVHSGQKVYWMSDAEASERLRFILPRLDSMAARHNVIVALETAEWFNGHPDRLRLAADAGLARVRLCLDLAHLTQPEHGVMALGRYASLAALVTDFAPQTAVVHVHDAAPAGAGAGVSRHHHPLAAGGQIDFEPVVQALVRAQYSGPYIQELSPANLAPEAVLASVRYLQEMLRRAR